MKNNPTHESEIIGYVNSPFKEKFGIPRQANLSADIPMQVIMTEQYSRLEMFRGLDEFSHIWVLFLFHQHLESGWKPTVRPPRLGGKEKKGVFATRSSFRPNAIGMSVVKLIRMEEKDKSMVLHLQGGDFVDQTPVIDIKPYIPYADSLSDAEGGFAENMPEAELSIEFESKALEAIAQKEEQIGGVDLKELIEAMISTDPRPGHYKRFEKKKHFVMRLYDFEFCWRIEDNQVVVESLAQP